MTTEVERAHIHTILDEQNLGASERVDPSRAALLPEAVRGDVLGIRPGAGDDGGAGPDPGG